MTHPRMFRRFATLLLCTLLTACAGVANMIGPQKVEVPVERLQQGLAKSFPIEQRMLEFVAIQLSQPHLAITSHDSRVALAFDTALSMPLVPTLKGQVMLSGRLQLNAAQNAIVVREARLEKLSAGKLDDTTTRLLTRALNQVIEQSVRELPVYQFKPDELRYAGIDFVPQELTTKPNALVITLIPASKQVR